MVNVNVEMAVIGSVLLTNGEALDGLQLKPSHFANHKLSRTFETMLQMSNKGQAIDVITVGAMLPDYAADLHEWVQATPTANSIDFYARTVLEQARRRDLALAGSIMLEASQNEDVEATIDKARRLVDDMEAGSVIDLQPVSQTFFDVIEQLNNKVEFPKSPWNNLNSIIGGFRPGTMTIVGARPGVGKTLIGLQIADALAQHGTTLMFSMEMSKIELEKRRMARIANVPFEELVNNNVSFESENKLAMAREVMDVPLILVDRGHVTVPMLRSYIRRARKNGPVSAIVVDYLGLMQDTHKSSSRYEKYSNISNDLKQLALEMQIPFIVLSQLNRGIEGRPESDPMMSDLRDSGSIEQDADLILLLNRKRDGSEPDGDQGNLLIINVAKNRNGRMGKIGLKLQLQYQRAVGSV